MAKFKLMWLKCVVTYLSSSETYKYTYLVCVIFTLSQHQCRNALVRKNSQSAINLYHYIMSAIEFYTKRGMFFRTLMMLMFISKVFSHKSKTAPDVSALSQCMQQ